jgi:hypothetical protein
VSLVYNTQTEQYTAPIEDGTATIFVDRAVYEKLLHQYIKEIRAEARYHGKECPLKEAKAIAQLDEQYWIDYWNSFELTGVLVVYATPEGE